MSIEHSAGAIVFRRNKDTILYLLLHYGAGHWDFAKGHIEKGESEEEALRREVFEETGIKDLELVPGFHHTMEYFFKQYITTLSGKIKRGNENVTKFVVFYLAETKSREVKLSFEHTGYKWLPYSLAEKQLTFKNAKELLTEANNFLAVDK